MEIKKENIVNAYAQGDDSVKTMLCTMFPDIEFEAETAVDDRPVTERIKTFGDACKELGLDAEAEIARLKETWLTTPKDVAYWKLRIIEVALNEGWKPQFVSKEMRYYPCFDVLGNVYAFATYESDFAHSGFTFKSKELAQYAGVQFEHLWRDYLLG